MNVKFDWNEWYFIITAAIALIVFLPIRKYFSLAMIVVIWMYNLVLVATIDYFFIATPFHLYYFGDNPTYELSGALYHFFMYPCCSVIFLFIYDKFELYGKKTIGYVVCWTAFSLFFEWLCVQNRVLNYTGWKLYYSIAFYPTAAIVLIALFRFTKGKLHELALPKLRV
ncbi:hypothetical protein A8990_106150 [Paenibacillus taihuensis]|uniref:Uncharacterized protein n=1 Tax=Paenibacillus taihuensis TaxID=1156355 RepID=A0A3D9SCE9_9BACL|nr:hypothetical protein [Paenibacillus taihuensis]REE90645.1 hypothetical protein A8990_106150 [Paenibacillus taihuensis]